MLFVQQNWMLILVAFGSGAMLVWPLVQRRLSPMKEIGTLGATQLINGGNALILDLREAKDYDSGRLPNARHVPMSQLGARAAELARDASRPVIAYCDTGQRSRGAGATLHKAGFKEIYHLTGGIRAWKAAGLPVEKAS